MRSKDKNLMNKIVCYIDNEYQLNGRTPTMRDIAKEMQISLSSVKNYLVEMETKGMLVNVGGSRGIVTNSMKKIKQSTMNIPIVGSIACGLPLLAEQNIEKYLPIPSDFLGNGKFFILKASGNSMINAGISDGDYVIVKQQENAEEGQIVVALIDDEATLKRYYIDKTRKQIRLHPENDNMKDMYYKNIIIQGVAVKVIKDLF